MLKSSDFTPEFCSDVILEHSGKQAAARALYGTVMTDLGTLATMRTIETYLLRGNRLAMMGREDPDQTSRLEKLLEKANVPLNAIGSIGKVKFSQWGYQQKGPDGEPITGVLDSTEVHLEPSAPLFPVVNHAKPNIIQFNEAPRILRQTRSVVIISDTQVGFLQDPETKAIEPIHDPIAMRVSNLVAAAVCPDELCFIGDYMDWPFLSRWQQHDEFDAVNESIQEAYDQLCLTIAAAGPQVRKKIMIGGNHDIRPEKMLLEHNRKAMRVRRAADTSGWPVFSQPYLLRYDELGIHYPGHYPGGEYYLLPKLLLTHAPPKAKEFQASVIHGHTHHITRATSVQHNSCGRETYFNYDVGCLCQVGSTENRQRLMVTRVPSDRARTDWAQGMAVVNIVGEEFFSVDQISILDGRAIYNGQVFDGREVKDNG